jgi:hypothetical protein
MKGDGMNFKSKYNMFDILKDKVSGFTGIVLAISFYDTGCTHYGVAPQNLKEDGGLHTWEWFDESRLILINKSDEKITKNTSGPDKNPACK